MFLWLNCFYTSFILPHIDSSGILCIVKKKRRSIESFLMRLSISKSLIAKLQHPTLRAFTPNMPTSYCLPQACQRCWCTTHSLADCSKMLALAFSPWRGGKKKRVNPGLYLTSLSKPLFIKEDWTSCSGAPETKKWKDFFCLTSHLM